MGAIEGAVDDGRNASCDCFGVAFWARIGGGWSWKAGWGAARDAVWDFGVAYCVA